MVTPSLPNRLEESEDGGKMSFFEHLAELRTRLIHASGAIVVGTFIGVYVAKHILEFVARPMVNALRAANLPDKLIFTHPAGYLYQVITLGLYLGIVIASIGRSTGGAPIRLGAGAAASPPISQLGPSPMPTAMRAAAE